MTPWRLTLLVGLVGELMVERPKVEKEKVVGWDVNWGPNRPFAIDMAGFAVNLKLFLSKNKAKFAYQAKVGHQESEFLKHLVTTGKAIETDDQVTRVAIR